MDTIESFIKLYWRMLASLGFVVFAFSMQFGNDTVIGFQELGIDIKITKTLAVRLALIIAAITLLSRYLTFDYSRFFPSQLEFEVFYDESGIDKSLKVFSKEELSQLGYHGKNRKLLKSYFEDLDEKLREILSYQKFFTQSDGIVHSRGDSVLKVEQKSGIHNYYISDAYGHLTHVLEAPQHGEVSFVSRFYKMPSPDDYIRPNYKKLILDQELVISPKFKQAIAEKIGAKGVIFDHILISATKIYLFPYPKFSNTVYFFDGGEEGIVPIGYAVYK